MNKLTICIDFDGVVHAYSKGWQDGSIYDAMVTGFTEWAALTKDTFKLVIYSSRSKTPEGIQAMKDWFATQWADEKRIGVNDLEFAHKKPAAYLTIDDRALKFDGNWSAAHWDANELLKFKPWNKA
jgi:hypothetical protein